MTENDKSVFHKKNDEINDVEIMNDDKLISKKQTEVAPKSEKQKPKKAKSKNKAWVWPLKIFFLTFVMSICFSLSSEILMSKSHLIISFVVVVCIIFIAIIFDVIGVSATACSVEPYLSMASRKIKGAKMAVKLVKNSEKVSSICADVIGDICGIVSGACGAGIAIRLFTAGDAMAFIGGVLVSACIAALTVGGKAIGKRIAMAKCQQIVFFVAKILSVFSKNK